MKVSKRYIVGLIIGVAVFAAAFGMAASLGGLNSDTLGAGDDVVAACDVEVTPDGDATNDGIDVSYDTIYTPDVIPGYKVDKVILSDVNAACEGMNFKILLTGTGDNLEVQSTGVGGVGVLDLTAGSATIEFPNTKLAKEVDAVHVVITDA